MKVSEHVKRLLRQGQKPKELIELGFPKSVVTRVRRQLKEEKATSQKQEPERAPGAETQAQTPPESPETIATMWQKVQSMANDLQRIDPLIQAVSIIITAAQKLGTYRHEECQHHKEGLCRFWMWKTQDEIPKDIGEPTYVGDEDPGWYVKPSMLYCAMCVAPVEDRVADFELDALGTPLWDARNQITCQNCGSKGWIATLVKCTKCGHVTFWGWRPKEE